jgi:hypothetical protein
MLGLARELANQPHDFKRVMRRALIVLPAAVFSLAAWLPAGAQSPEEISTKYEQACQRTIDFTLAKLRPHLAEHPALQSKNDLVLMVPASDYNAFADYANQRVLIPVMWCVQTYLFIDAALLAAQDVNLKPKFIDYIRYLDQRQRAAVRKGGFDTVPVVSFEAYAKFKRASQAPEQQRQEALLREDVILDAIAFVLGHEIGHLALKHKPASHVTPTASRRQENEADIFAVALTQKAGFAVFFAWVTLQRFFVSEAELKGTSGTRSHPRAECRIERIWAVSEIRDWFKDPARRRDFERRSGYSVPAFQRLMADLRDDCKANP